MNTEYILNLADRIEKMPHTDVTDPSGFTMVDYRHHCGTPACIAGHVIDDERIDPNLVLCDEHEVVAEVFGISEAKADSLCLASGVMRLNLITPQWAAACLRHLARTGEVDWPGTKPQDLIIPETE